MTKLRYNGKKPRFKSEFLDNSIEKDLYNSVFLGFSNVSSKSGVDLFLITYSNGKHNAVIQYGKNDYEYSSGIEFMYRDVADGRKSDYNTLFRRAIKEGLLTETTAYVGYSALLEEELDELYYNSEYFKNRPSYFKFLNELDENLTDEEEDKAELEYENLLSKYNEMFKNTIGEVPKKPANDNFHVFKSKESAEHYCSTTGIYEEISFVNEEHLRAICKNKNFLTTVLRREFKANKLCK